jgi:transcriptional regulator with PAS, ATPase and Fis domain
MPPRKSAGSRRRTPYLRAQLQDRFKIDGMMGRTPVMLELFELLRTVAATPSTVLITGDTGTGKELAARAIHDGSPRRNQRFVAINCSAIPETLLEAELFGHVRGAFTGAWPTGRAASNRRIAAPCSWTRSGR